MPETKEGDGDLQDWRVDGLLQTLRELTGSYLPPIWDLYGRKHLLVDLHDGVFSL
jgi:hypothetical protein